MMDKLAKILTSAQEAHVDLEIVSTHLVVSPALVITALKSEITETVKILMNALKLANVKMVTASTPMVDLLANATKVTKKLAMDEFATTSMSAPEKTIHAVRELAKTWMVISSVSAPMDFCQELMDLAKTKMNA
jgi:hypothetical protein